MSGDSRVELVHRFFSGTGPTYDLVVNLCTIGFDVWWKKKILEMLPERPLRAIDQACGTGILTFKIALKFPRCHVIGIELREEYLSIANQKKKVLKTSNVEFVLGRAEDVFLNENFDFITSSYLAKYAELGTLIRNAKKMLRRDGVLVVHDFTYPPSRGLARILKLYFSFMQRVGGWKYPQWRTIFYGLPALLSETQWVADLIIALKKNGFANITIDSLTFGISTIVTARNL